MARDSSGRGTGTAESERSPLTRVSREVLASFLLWFTAVAAGVVETVLGVSYSLAGGMDRPAARERPAFVISVVTSGRSLRRRWRQT